MVRIATAFCSVASLLLAAGTFATDLNGDLIQTSGNPSVAAGRFYGYRTASEGPGNDAFAKAKALAEAEGVPLVVVWSHESCHFCSDFIADINGHSADAKKWMTENRAVFAFFKATGYDPPNMKDDDHAAAGLGYTSPKACLDAWNFIDIRGAAYNHYWPLVEFYYKPPTGPAIYCDDPDDSGKSFTWLADRYAKWVRDNRIGDGNGRFTAVGGTEYDRYEVDEGTTNLYVRLEREKNASALVWTNDLVGVWPNGAGVTVTQQVAWAAGESARMVSLPLVRTADLPVGKDIALTLYDHADGSVRGVVSAVCVKVETNASNPLWIGERDKDTLAWGEWTMDLDVATQKVAAVTAGRAYTLVLLAGSLWCPDCYNTDHHFLDATNAAGEVRFTKWAQDRRVALVTVDLPSLGDATAITPTLVNRDSGLGYFDKTGAFAMISKSGLGYLSRKNASEDAAAAVLARNMYLASHNTDDGGFHRPEDSKVYRTGVPIFVLLRKDGSVAARFTRWADVSPADSTNWDSYIRRFDELLSIADGEHADPSEIENNHPSSTTNAVPSADGMAKGELCNADFRDAFRLDGAGEGTYQIVEVSGADAANVKVSFHCKDAAGKVEAVKGAETTGSLSGGVSLFRQFEKKGEYFVQIEGADITSPEFSDACAKQDNFHAYTVETKSVLEPAEKAAEAQASSGSTKVQMLVEEGVEYRVTGIAGGVPGKFESKGGDIYLAKVDGVVELTTLVPGGTVVFQIWRPGKVEFRDPKGVRVIEYAETGIVTVVRSGGSSGSNVVSVVCDNPPGDDRFEWKNTTLVWADGESGERSVRFPIRPNGTYDPDVSFRVRLLAGDPCPAKVSSATNVVTVSDTNMPCLERTVYDLSANLNFETALGFNAYNISSAAPTISVVPKSGNVPSGLSFSYRNGQFVLSGAPSAEGTYEFKVEISDKRGSKTEKTPSDFQTTIRITVVDQSENNPKLAEGRPNTSMPIYCEIGNGTNVIEGSLRFAITSTGKISAKYSGTEGAELTFAGNWLTIDEVTGLVSNRLAATSDSAAKLSVTMDAEGSVNLVLDLPDRYSYFKGSGGVIRLGAESDWPDTSVDFTPWKGTYNVTFPSLGRTPTNVPTGTGFLSLRMESGLAAKSGLVIVAGVLSDGTPVSGSCQMLRDRMFEGLRTDTVAYLPIFRRTGNSCFSAATEIGRDGAIEWNTNNYDNVRQRLCREIVYAPAGTMAMSLYRDAAWEYLTLHDVCGSYYVPGVSPLYLQTEFGYSDTLFARFAVGSASASARYGRIAIPADAVQLEIGERDIDFAESIEGMAFGFNPQTGIFCGAAKLTYENDEGKKKMSVGYYRGVLLPGWIDCNCGHNIPLRPYGSGTFYFKDTINKKTANRSFSVDLDK